MTNFHLVKGDLFDPAFGFNAIGHGVNCKGAMGAGIAKVFRQRYPEMYENYRIMCHYGILKPGGAYVYEPDSGPVILNLASQNELGPDARTAWLAQSLHAACESEEIGVYYKIGLPLIGAGIGGLDKEQTIHVIRQVSKLFPGLDFTVVEL